MTVKQIVASGNGSVKIVGTIVGIVSVLLTFYLIFVRPMEARGYDNRERIVKLETRYEDIQKNLEEIKGMLKGEK